MLNLSGPKKVDCVPMQKSKKTSHQRCIVSKAAAVRHMRTISTNFIMRIRKDFSYLSAICPASDEKRKNGRMKSPATAVIMICALTSYSSAR